MSKQKLKYLILLNLLWSILGFFADYQWLSSIPVYLIPFTAICSLYPPLLSIWYILKYYHKIPPNWLTLWILVGTTTYGLLAQIYFPLLMSWKGVNFHDIGSMFWVAVYGCQAVILWPYLKKPKPIQISFVIAFLLAANYSHYFLQTFVFLTLTGYPLWLGMLTAILTIVVQITALIFYTVLASRPISELKPS
mgnify:CR=1 FL=1